MDLLGLQTLKSSGSKQVRIRTYEGELLDATVFLISDDEADVIVELVSSNQMEKYTKLGPHPALLIKFSEIESVELAEPSASNDRG
jgi:hypothetical protein